MSATNTSQVLTYKHAVGIVTNDIASRRKDCHDAVNKMPSMVDIADAHQVSILAESMIMYREAWYWYDCALAGSGPSIERLADLVEKLERSIHDEIFDTRTSGRPGVEELARATLRQREITRRLFIDVLGFLKKAKREEG